MPDFYDQDKVCGAINAVMGTIEALGLNLLEAKKAIEAINVTIDAELRRRLGESD